MQNVVNIEAVLKEIAELKRQLEQAQVRLATLESLLQAAAQAQVEVQDPQEQPAQQALRPVQPGPQLERQPERPVQEQPVQQVKQALRPVQQAQVKQAPRQERERAAQRKPKFEGDVKLALAILEMIDRHGDLRISLIKWYLSSDYEIRATEREIIEVVKALERLEALKGTWSVPGPFGSRTPIVDPWADRGPEFSPVRRRLEELRNKRR
jgi:hypothetical protein